MKANPIPKKERYEFSKRQNKNAGRESKKV